MDLFRAHTAPLLVVAFLALLLAAAATGPVAEASPTRSYVAKVNDARASHGLHRLRVSRSLQRSSVAYSRWMVRRGFFGHLSSIRASRRFRLRGEVLARMGAPHVSAGETVAAWLRSPAHRSVLLNPRFRFIGIGRARESFASEGATLVTGHLGAR